MSEGTHVGELLRPAAQAIETARLVLGVAAFAVLLVVGGAHLERWLLKRRLSVIDSYAEGHAEGVRTAEWARSEGTGGGRS